MTCRCVIILTKFHLCKFKVFVNKICENSCLGHIFWWKKWLEGYANFWHKTLPVIWKHVLPWVFVSSARFFTEKKIAFPLLSNREILQKLYFLRGGIICELANITSSSNLYYLAYVNIILIFDLARW